MKYYVTTPIYYVNDKPHVGHAYATFAADTLARYQRMLGHDVFFLTGTDENAEKNVEAASKADEQDVQDYVDRMSAVWQATWDELGISNDDFIRTTEARHKKGVEKFWRTVLANGDIYKGNYQGLYCVSCEAFYVKSDLTDDGLCPDHLREPESIEEENYFFKLSKYRDQLLAHIEANDEFIQPISRRNEIVNYIKDHLEDISISRPNKTWGIKVPDDDSQTIYVWFDALINYLTAIGYGSDDEQFANRWPAAMHIVGKDIIKFHVALWPAMLLSAGLELPQRIFAHGFFTIDGQKISKTVGNTIDPRDLVETYGVNTLRYFLLREIHFGSDGDFSIERVAGRYDSDLVNGLGNIVSRVTAMAAGQEGLVPNQELANTFSKTWSRYHKAFDSAALHDALEATWETMSACDRYVEQTKPWQLKKDESQQDALQGVLGELVESLRQLGWLLTPFFPDEAQRIFATLGWPDERQRPIEEAIKWGNWTTPSQVEKIAPLFPRIEV